MTNPKAKIPLYEQVVHTLRDQIVSGVYRKGDFLPSEKELIDSMGVSRITVRKALSIMQDIGFIRTSKGRRGEVVFDVEDMRKYEGFSEELQEYRRAFMESTEVRLMLEPEIAKRVAMTATDEQIEFLRDHLNDKSGKDPQYDFHRAIVAVLNNQELAIIMDQLINIEESKAPTGVLTPSRQEKVEKDLDAQHKRIFDAIEQRDGEFAYFYMKEHTKYIQTMYEKYFEEMDKMA